MWENYYAADNFPKNTNNLQQQTLPETQKIVSYMVIYWILTTNELANK